MSALPGSCDLPVVQAGEHLAGSRVLRLGADFRWQGVPVTEYKQSANHWAGVARTVLVGDRGEKTSFQVRYFEIAPGGFSSLERHAHEHAVVILRGRGQVRLGNTVHDLAFGDVVYVAPNEPHQFRSPPGGEPFGFLCIVDVQRDPPVPLAGP